MKIDRIEQIVSAKNVDLFYRIKSKDFVITPIGENLAHLKTNPGKTINNGMNLGALPSVAELINYEIIKNLKLELINLNKIEYCIDIETPFKLVDNKHILKTFYKALIHFHYKRGKLDFITDKNLNIENTHWKGLKGYKTDRSIKLYSKFEEKNIISEIDLLRLELSFGKRTIEQNEINNITNTEKARKELLEFVLYCDETLLKNVNRYSKNTRITINLFKKKLIKNSL